ncbi:MAG: hypothetical protein IPL08_05875 [Saprospiraceae bacterium]|nr:hypothetical protein [Saprospiraceae bacterium]MBK8670004.1 hypothetical protein [Saprospiraceae bacterium]
MKKLLLFALPLFLFSCKSGVDAHKTAIEELGKNWDAATASVTGFSESLTKDVTGYTEAAGTMMLDEAATAALKGDAAKKWSEATAAYKAATADAYAPVQTELNDFVTMWTEKAAGVTALKDGLAAGKIEGDVAGQIAELSGLATQATEKVTAWTAKQAELKTAADSALGMLKSAYEMVAPKK